MPPSSNSAGSISSSTTRRCGAKSRSPRWSYAAWREILDVTLDGTFHCVKACLPALRKSGAGTIVNIGGLSAHTGAKNRAHVVTAKAGIIGFTRALAHDLADDGITVNCVVPGLIGTPRPKDKPEPAHHLTHRPSPAIGAGRKTSPRPCVSCAGPARAISTGRRSTPMAAPIWAPDAWL